MEEMTCSFGPICAATCSDCLWGLCGCAGYESLVAKGELPPVEQKEN